MRAELRAVPGGPAQVVVLFVSESGGEWLATPRAFVDSYSDGDYFEFDPVAPYLDIVVKRGPYDPDELFEVSADEPVESRSVELRTLYELPDSGTVRVRYSAGHPLGGPAEGGGPFLEVTSEWLTVHL